MNNRKAKSLLAVIATFCSASSAFAVTDTLARRNFNIQVPEGGSATAYLVGAGLVCFGAMFLRSKLAKAPQA
jgi:hypothetical protein